MGQKKLKRFAEIAGFPNVLQHPVNMQGKWNQFFRNDNPIILELACGKGEYTTGLAEIYPERNYVGVDLKGNRIWTGAKKALANNLNNVAFLRTQIDSLGEYFLISEVQEIWITFPDPQLRISRAKKRLTHPRFLRIYKQILQQNGIIHLKTDSPELYRFTKLVIDMYSLHLHTEVEDVNSITEIPAELKIKTYYESLDIAKSNRVHYLSFSLSEGLSNIQKDEELKLILKSSYEETIQ